MFSIATLAAMSAGVDGSEVASAASFFVASRVLYTALYIIVRAARGSGPPPPRPSRTGRRTATRRRPPSAPSSGLPPRTPSSLSSWPQPSPTLRRRLRVRGGRLAAGTGRGPTGQCLGAWWKRATHRTRHAALPGQRRSGIPRASLCAMQGGRGGLWPTQPRRRPHPRPRRRPRRSARASSCTPQARAGSAPCRLLPSSHTAPSPRRPWSATSRRTDGRCPGRKVRGSLPSTWRGGPGCGAVAGGAGVKGGSTGAGPRSPAASRGAAGALAASAHLKKK